MLTPEAFEDLAKPEAMKRGEIATIAQAEEFLRDMPECYRFRRVKVHNTL